MDFEFDPSKSRNRKYPDESIYQSAPAPFQEADTSFQLQEMEKEIEQLFKSSADLRRALQVSQASTPVKSESSYTRSQKPGVDSKVLTNIEQELKDAANLFSKETSRMEDELSILKDKLRNQELDFDNEKREMEMKFEKEKDAYLRHRNELVSRIRELETYKDKLEKELEMVRFTESTFDTEEVVKLRSELTDLKMRNARMKTELETNKEYLSRLQHNLVEVERSRDSLIDQTQKMSQTIPILQTELNKSIEEHSKLQYAYKQLQENMYNMSQDTVRNVRDSYEAKLSTMEKEKNALKNELKDKEIEKKRLESKLDELIVESSRSAPYRLSESSAKDMQAYNPEFRHFEEQMHITARRISMLEDQLKKTRNLSAKKHKSMKERSLSRELEKVSKDQDKSLVKTPKKKRQVIFSKTKTPRGVIKKVESEKKLNPKSSLRSSTPSVRK